MQPKITSVAISKRSNPGLEPIPENDIPQPGSTYNPNSHPHTLLPVSVPKPVTTTYNISFPASNTLSQFSRDHTRYDPWRSNGSQTYYSHRNMSPGSTSGVSSGSSYFYSCSSTSSPSSLQVIIVVNINYLKPILSV